MPPEGTAPAKEPPKKPRTINRAGKPPGNTTTTPTGAPLGEKPTPSGPAPTSKSPPEDVRDTPQAAPPAQQDTPAGQPPADTHAPPAPLTTVAEVAPPAPDFSEVQIPGVSFTQADSIDLDKMKIMSLIYGDSGAGKTHFATAGVDGVLVALVDTQGFATIRSANPKAIVAGSPDKAVQGQPRLQNMEQVREFFRAVAAGHFLKLGVKTIVVDHITELQQMMIDEILKEKRQLLPKQNPPAGGTDPKDQAKKKGPAPEMTMADWGVLATRMRNFLRMLRGMPHHIVVLALAEPSTDESTGRRLIFPRLSGSAQAALPSYFNIVGYIYKTLVGGVVQRVVLLDGDDRYATKSYGPINGIAQADLRLWQHLLAGGDGDAVVQGAKPPGANTSGKPRGGTPAPPATPPAGQPVEGAQAEEEAGY